MKLDFLKKAWETFEKVHRDRAVEVLEQELEELDNMFCLLSMSCLAGFPMPLFYHSLDYLPYMEKELENFFHKAENAQDMMASIAALTEL